VGPKLKMNRGPSSSGTSRVLSKPSSPRANNGLDNENDDLILRTGEELGANVGASRGATTSSSQGSGKGHPRDDEEMSDASSSTYTILDSLGSGTFGQVVSVASNSDGHTKALKVIKNHPAYFHQAHVEIGILRTLNTKCAGKPGSSTIVDLVDYFVCHNHLCLVFELLGMNLYELLRKNKFKGLHLGAIRGMMKQLLGALDLLRDAHVVHCDIKPENILLCKDNSFQVKLVDFGSACFQNRTVYQYIQSRFYRSPEVFLGMPYGMPIDMWSLGCVAAELFLGLPIFPGSSEYDLLSRICETIGTPPADMLGRAPNTNKFFTRVDVGFNDSSSSLASTSDETSSSKYKLMSLREFEARTGKRTAMGKKYFKYTEFSDIIASIPYKASTLDPSDEEAVEEEKRQRMVERSSFYDLLTGMMEIDPSQRWTPSQALQHPFITGEPFEGPFSPETIPERTTAEEREELQRVAAKEAARVSSGSPVKKKKKQDVQETPQPPKRGMVPPTPPVAPVGGLAAAFAAGSSSVSPQVLNSIHGDGFNSAAMLQAHAQANAVAAVMAMSPGGIPMSPGGGLGGGYPPFMVGSAGGSGPGSLNSASSMISGSFIGSPHATNSAAMHPLHFGLSPPTHQLSSMGLSTSHQVRVAQAAAAVQLPPASPLGPRGSFLSRGSEARNFKPGSSFTGNFTTWNASASSSRDNLKTLQTVHESLTSPPSASPSPVQEDDEDHAEGADWDPTFDKMLDDEKPTTQDSLTGSPSMAAPLANSIPMPKRSVPQNGTNAAAHMPVGSAPNFIVPGQFSVSPNSAFEMNKPPKFPPKHKGSNGTGEGSS